jgi:hypothetical protein
MDADGIGRGIISPIRRRALATWQRPLLEFMNQARRLLAVANHRLDRCEQKRSSSIKGNSTYSCYFDAYYSWNFFGPDEGATRSQGHPKLSDKYGISHRTRYLAKADDGSGPGLDGQKLPLRSGAAHPGDYRHRACARNVYP